MNSTVRQKKPYNRKMRSKTADDVLSLDSDPDIDSDSDSDPEIKTGLLESLDLNDNEHLMVIAIDFGTT